MMAAYNVMTKAILVLALMMGLSRCTQQESLELTESSACEICVCGPGPSSHPKELAKCNDIKKPLEIISLPAFVRGLHINGAKHGVVFKRGAIRVKSKSFVFMVTIEKASHVDFQEKSTTILTPNGTVRFDLREIAQIKLRSRAVSTASGNFELNIERSVAVDIDGQAFDVMNKVRVDGLVTLNLAPAAFKPNVPMFMQQPFTKIDLRNIDSIPTLPMEAFSSALSISFFQCKIGDVEASAFSGVSVFNITFESTSIDRIHTDSFPDKALVQRLSFINCTLTSVSEKAVASAISTLSIQSTNVSSISTEAFNVHVANVDVSHSVFKTLVKRSFVFQSWNEVIFNSNLFMFLEDGCFAGITEPNSATSSFQLVSNKIQYANRNALKIDTSTALLNTTDNNIFHEECDCDTDKWLMIVSGETDLKNPSNWATILLNSSLCEVPAFAKGCFKGQDNVAISTYSNKMCSFVASNEDCSYESPWEIIREQIEVNTNKGILLLVLIFVLASTLVVGIVTLLRWIVYTIQMRKFRKNDEWSFTKVEQQKFKHTDNIEEEAIELEESPSPTQHYESLPLTTNTEVNTPPGKKASESGNIDDADEPLLKANMPEVSVGKPPTQKTFYDEMISLLQEKLQDPDNYATVVDDTEMTNNATLYMDPMHVQNNPKS